MGEPTPPAEETTPVPTTTAPTTSSSPTTTATPTTTEPEPDTPSVTPTATTEATKPKRTEDPEPADSSNEPTADSGKPTRTSATPAESAEPEEEAVKKVDAGGLSVWTGPLALHGAPTPGAIVSGQMTVQVEDTRPDSKGWNVDVKTTPARGSGGETFTPGPDSYYRAADTACSTSTGTVPLTMQERTVATSTQKCPDARWTSDVGIAVPADVRPDNYSLTITHSVY